MTKGRKLLITVLLIGVVTFSSVLITNKMLGRTRLDLTQHGLYTLSDGTRSIIGSLNQPLDMRLYYSRVAALKGPEQIRYFNNYYLYVRELLQEYVALSGGRLELEVLDPRPFSEAEEEAGQYGIRSFPITEDESFYFGLAVTSELGKDAVIDFFEPERQEFVEYDISKLLVEMQQTEKKTIGILSSLPVMGDNLSPYMRQMMQMQGRQPAEAWNIKTHLEQQYDVVPVETSVTVIPENIDYLLIIHPKNLGPETLYAIDQYVMAGGDLIVFTDPFSVNDQPPQNPENPMAGMNHDASSNLNALLGTWGISMEAFAIAADPEMAITAQLSQQQPPQPIPVFLSVGEDNVNKEEVITGKLHDMRMLYAGVLKKTDRGKDVKIEPLLTLTESGGIYTPSNPFELRMPNPEAMIANMKPQEEPVILAARLTGRLKSNYSDGAPLDWLTARQEELGEDFQSDNPTLENPDHLSESRQETSVVVVADVDMISDVLAYQQAFFGIQQVGDNASLLLNTIDFLGGSPELISIRSRGKFRRPFDVVDEIETRAEEQTAERVEAINQEISQYEARLEELGTAANDENVRLLENQAMQERREIQNRIREARAELRQLNAGKRESIENLGFVLQTINMVLAPAAVLLIAIFLGGRSWARKKKFMSRRTQE